MTGPCSRHHSRSSSATASRVRTLVFAFLIIPATTSALFSGDVRKRLVIAWASGAVASFLGILFAYELDFSVGPSVALFLGLALVAAALWRV